MFASSARSPDGTIVGGWSVDASVTSTAAGCPASAHLTNSLVLLPDSEILAPVSIRSPSGIQSGWCSLIEPKIAISQPRLRCSGCLASCVRALLLW